MSYRLELDNGLLLDCDARDLGIKLQRIVEDFTNPSRRFGEFSRLFNLPKTKNNRLAFEYPDAKGRRKIFVNKEFGCKVFFNNQIVLRGSIQLVEFDSENYKCLLSNQFKQLIDDIKDKELVDLTSLPTLEYAYNGNENFIADHIIANHKNSDYTDYQFPLIFYRTFDAPGKLDPSNFGNNRLFMDSPKFNFNYIFNETMYPATTKMNGVYFHQLPPAIYMTSIFRAILSEAGWTVGGTFFNNEDIKRIIIPFTGDPDALTGASGKTASYRTLNLNKTLPEMSQMDFLSAVISTFNLFFTIDLTSKVIKFETWSTLFRSANDNAYDITDKVFQSSVSFFKQKDPDVKIQFEKPELNNKVAGYDYCLSPEWSKYDNNNPWFSVHPKGNGGDSPPYQDSFQFAGYSEAQDRIMNKVSGTKSLSIGFSQPNYFTARIYTLRNRLGTTYSTTGGAEPAIAISIPLITTQTKLDNDGANQNAGSGSTFLDNSIAIMKYGEGLQMYYYYGTPNYDLAGTGSGDLFTTNYNDNKWNGAFRDWVFINVITGGTSLSAQVRRVPVGVASPFKLVSRTEYEQMRTITKTYFTNTSGQTESSKGELGAEVRYLISTFFMAGSILNDDYQTSAFSLTFGDNDQFIFDNIYTKFHKKKYDLLINSEMCKLNMRMDENDWREMDISRTIRFNDEFYHLIHIKNYDPDQKNAEVQMIKKQ